MKLLLTSNGLSNEAIANALEELVGKSRQETKIAFIPNAAFPLDDFKHESRDWFVNDLYRIKEFCGFIDVVSLSDLTKEEIKERLEYADVIFVSGGNTFYQSYIFEKSGLFELLPELLKTRVYAGISAGSMIVTHSIRSASQAIKNPDKFIDKEYGELGPEGRSGGRSAQLVDFCVRPHYGSKSFPGIADDFLGQIARDAGADVYAIDDGCAVKVDGDKVEVVGGGNWKLVKCAK